MTSGARCCWWRAALIGVGLALLGGCKGTGYEVRRPWTEDPAAELEAVQLGDITRPCRRVSGLPASLTSELGAVEPGFLTTFVGLASPPPASARVEVRLRTPSSEGEPEPDCQLDWSKDVVARSWQPCRIAIPRGASHATLEMRFDGSAGAELLVASPVLSSSRAARRPPVFIFLLDTLRADRLVTFNRDLPLGVHLDQLAHDAIVFERVRSSSSWTRTAVATLLTGLGAQAHGVLDRPDVLPTTLATLPEILQPQGYQTVAWSANANILPIWGFGRGFDAFIDAGALRWAKQKTHAKVVLSLVREFIEQEPDQASLYYIHLMDAHFPYTPEASDLRTVRGDERLMTSFPAPVSERTAKVAEEYPEYLAEILGMDEQLGEFFDYLKARGLYDRSLILLVGDHGEEFLEHGGSYHGRTLYEEVLRVPAWLKLPGGTGAGTRITSDVSLADFMPTVLGALQVPVPPHLDGRALVRGNAVADPNAAPAQAATLKLDDIHLSSIVQRERKLIVNYRGPDLLFDLQRDPREQTNLLSAQPEQAQDMRRLLDAVAAGREQGWHIRGCGTDTAAEIRFTVASAGADVRSALFEDDDSLRATEHGAGGPIFEVAMNLRTRQVRREFLGRLLAETAWDEDEVLIVPREENGLSAVELRPLAAGPLVYAPGVEDVRVSAGVISLDSASPKVRVRASETVDCFARRTGSAGQLPYLRVWYVPPAENLRASSVDPAVAERLRVLGYRW